MAKQNSSKGAALEKAVAIIEETILSKDPRLRGFSFSVELNKIFTIDGVRHEVDVFVTTAPNTPYEGRWIFECKNWKEPVGKNEIIILAEKVQAVAASSGFIVARELTKDAAAQLKLNKRLTFVRCADEFADILKIQLKHTIREITHVEIALKERGVAPTDGLRNADLSNKPCVLDNRSMLFKEFILEQAHRIVAEELSQDPAVLRAEGGIAKTCCSDILFSEREFLIGSMEVERMRLWVSFQLFVRPTKLVSKFELSKRGRVYTFEPVDEIIPGSKIEVTIVTGVSDMD
jgi:hypothetical protein